MYDSSFFLKHTVNNNLRQITTMSRVLYIYSSAQALTDLIGVKGRKFSFRFRKKKCEIEKQTEKKLVLCYEI